MNPMIYLVGLIVFAGLLIYGSRKSKLVAKLSLYLCLILVALAMVLPFYWMFVLSTHHTPDIFKFPPPFWFGNALSDNFQFMNEAVPALRNFLNSVLVSVMNTALVLLFCSMGGYAFAIYRFPGRNALFGLLLGTMMVDRKSTRLNSSH